MNENVRKLQEDYKRKQTQLSQDQKKFDSYKDDEMRKIKSYIESEERRLDREKRNWEKYRKSAELLPNKKYSDKL
jgi:uncharacterized protein YlxW (UPF0749 family)